MHRTVESNTGITAATRGITSAIEIGRRDVWMLAAGVLALVVSLLDTGSNAAFADGLDSHPIVIGYERFKGSQQVSKRQLGKLLVTELGCTACHQSAGHKPKQAPRLDHLGGVDANWLAAYLSDPSGVDPGTTMPDLLAKYSQAERAPVIASLVAYLRSSSNPYPEIKGDGRNPVPFMFWNRGDSAAGQTLYHTVGCVACHESDDAREVASSNVSHIQQVIRDLEPEQIEALGLSGQATAVPSVPFGNLGSKYSRESLTRFLIDPHHFRPSGRMPDLKLQPVEAADLASYLLKRFGTAERELGESDPMPSVDALIASGKRYFDELGCNACHQSRAIDAGIGLTKFNELNPNASKGCLSDSGDRSVHYQLSSNQLRVVSEFITAESESNDAGGDSGVSVEDSVGDAVDLLQHRLLSLNCYACHSRGRVGGVGPNRQPYFETIGRVDLGDEGRLPPPLLHVGRKLRRDWMTSVISGKATPVRPHLSIRMPKYSLSDSKAIATSLVATDRKAPASNHSLKTNDPDALQAGRQLMDIGCVQCHSFRGHQLVGVVGVELSRLGQRLNPDWFRAFMHDPAALKPRTRMPAFFTGGKSQRPDVLGGDIEKQLSAIWSYLDDLPNQSLPEKIELQRSSNYELVPKDHPLMLRTFMEDVGTHAIAVGFPGGVNFAFDAEEKGLSIAWRGKFLDAQGTWFVRSAPPADPLGAKVVRLPGPPTIGPIDQKPGVIASLDRTRPIFLGYRLDSNQVPTFIYQMDEFRIAETVTAFTDSDSTLGLKRKLSIILEEESGSVSTAAIANRLSVCVDPGDSIKPDGSKRDRYVNANGLTTICQNDDDDYGERAMLRSSASGEESLWIPLKFSSDGQAVVEVVYQW